MRLFPYLFYLLILGCATTLPSRAIADDVPPDLGTRKLGTDWPGFLGPAGTSVSAEKGILAPWPREGPRIVWQKPLGAGYGMPSVSRGRLFHFDRDGDQARLTCLNSETGAFLWKFAYPTNYEDKYGYSNGPRCSPVIDGDRVYLFGSEGMLHCLRAGDGKLVWKTDTSAEFGVVQNFFGVGSTPVVDGGLLITQIGGAPGKNDDDLARTPKSSNSTGVVAFDKHTGKVKYRVSDELASYASPVLATIAGRRWCFIFARGGLIGMEPGTGQVHFHYPWRARTYESVNASCPVVVGDQVFISETYGPGSSLLKVKNGGCEVVWKDDDDRRQKNMQCHFGTPIYHDGYLYGSSGRHMNNAELRCIEWATGKLQWSQPNLTRTSLLLVDGHFICMSEDGMLRLLKVNPRKYEEVSRMVLRRTVRSADDGPGADLLLRPPCWEAPILSHGLLYVRGKDRLVCLELIKQ